MLPLRLRVKDFFEYLRPCYADWDRSLEEQIRGQLALPPNRKIGELSHGMRMKMALACALSFRPKLLVLDEPLSGLDPLARDELIDGFMHQASDTTILISSYSNWMKSNALRRTLVFCMRGGCCFRVRSERSRWSMPGLCLKQQGMRRVERPSLRDIFVAMPRAARKAAKDSTPQ